MDPALSPKFGLLRFAKVFDLPLKDKPAGVHDKVAYTRQSVPLRS